MRYHATPEGEVPFTPEEEAEADARELEWIAEEAQRVAKRQRQSNAKAILESQQFRNMIRSGKSKVSADAWVAAQNNPVDALAKLLMGVSAFIRYQVSSNDAFFEQDE